MPLEVPLKMDLAPRRQERINSPTAHIRQRAARIGSTKKHERKVKKNKARNMKEPAQQLKAQQIGQNKRGFLGG